MRLLLIAERAEYRLLVRKHVEIEWPDAFIVEHHVGGDLPLDPRFTAAGFDAAVVIASPPSGQADLLVAELVAKDEFAPVVFVQLRDTPSHAAASHSDSASPVRQENTSRRSDQSARRGRQRA